MTSANQSHWNNYARSPDGPAGTNNVLIHPRDPTYYYPDGTAVFLAEGILFKIHASLILPPESFMPSSSGNSQRYPTGVDNLPRRITNSSASKPITLPNITASQFRNYLFALLGSPSDPLYLALLRDAKYPGKRSQDLLVRYLDISCLARQFGKAELEEWARSQLLLVLESTEGLAGSNWDKGTLLRLNSYARASGIGDLISSARNFTQYFISISTVNETSRQASVFSNLDTCVQMYKDPNLPNDDPLLFGCVFACILSLGHRSTTWISSMSQRERTVLYAAQVQLTSIANEMESVDWLQSTISSLPSTDKLCWRCRSQLRKLWQKSFGECGDLRSAIPLQDIRALARLPQHRKLLVSQWGTFETCAKSKIRPRPQPRPTTVIESIFGMAGPPEPRPEPEPESEIVECTKLQLPLVDIDTRIQQVYESLARRHRAFSVGA